jgi:hypothetical protein
MDCLQVNEGHPVPIGLHDSIIIIVYETLLHHCDSSIILFLVFIVDVAKIQEITIRFLGPRKGDTGAWACVHNLALLPSPKHICIHSPRKIALLPV